MITIAEILKQGGYQTGAVGKWHQGDFRYLPQYHPNNHGFDYFYGMPWDHEEFPCPLYENKVMLIEEWQDRSDIHQVLADAASYFVKNAAQNNGPWFHGSTGGQRGRKGQSYEGGFRVPLIARWPGKIPPGSISDQPAINLDFLPTLAAVAGLEIPKDRIIDGRDISGLMTGDQKESPHDVLYFYHHAELEGIRTGKWKFYKEISTYTYPVPVDKWHFGGILRQPWLYNLEVDPTESYPMNKHHPELVESFIQKMAQWQKQMEADPKGFNGEAKR